MLALSKQWPRLAAAVLLVAAMRPLAALPVPPFDYPAFKCLATNAWHEARGESVAGVNAVTRVVLNRAKQKKKTVCEVAYQPWQFSWTMDKRKKTWGALEKLPGFSAVAMATLRELGGTPPVFVRHGPRHVSGKLSQPESPILLATHYHTKKVKPAWSLKFKRLGVIGNHVFYKEEK